MINFVSRHKGAIDWFREKGIKVDAVIDHLDVSKLKKGDVIIGTLPVHLAAETCAKGCRYMHLYIDLPREMRGQEINSSQMKLYNARLQEYRVETINEK